MISTTPASVRLPGTGKQAQVPHRLGLGCVQQQRQRWRRRKPTTLQSLPPTLPAWGNSEVGLEKYSQSVELEVMRDSWVSAGGRVRQGEP